MTSPRRLLAFVLAACVVAATGCGDGVQGPTVEVVDSAGVELVLNPGADRPAPVVLEPGIRLGGADQGPEAFYSVGRSGVATDGEGNVYVLDRDRSRVVVFDSAGTHLRSMGREGEGPGELSFPIGLVVEEDGAVHVRDIRRRELVSFDPHGEPAAGPGVSAVAVRSGLLAVRGDTVTFLDTGWTDGGARLIRVAGGDTATLVSIPGRKELPPIQLESCGMRFSGLPPLFARAVTWDTGPGGTAAAAGKAYAVEIFEGDRRVRSVRRDMPPPAATEALALAEVGDGMRVATAVGERTCDPAEVVEQRGFEEAIPVVEEVRVDPGGGLWVRRVTPAGGGSEIDVFAPDGAYRGTLPSGSPLPVTFLPDGRPLWVETDEFDVDRLVIGRVVEAATGEG